MNSPSDLRGRLNHDGSVDVWTKGHMIHFPAADGKPTSAKEPAPADAGPCPDGIEIRRDDATTWLARGPWFARVTDATAAIRPRQAKPTTTDPIFYRMHGPGND